MVKNVWWFFRVILIIIVSSVLLTRSQILINKKAEQVRAYTRELEFDYVNWTIDSLFEKNQTAAIEPVQYISAQHSQEILDRYFEQVQEINQLRSQIDAIYANPDIQNPDQVAAGELAVLERLEDENLQLARLSEAVLQQQISLIISELGLDVGGQLVPPLMYHVTPLPRALIISPREEIRQELDVSLQADLSIEQIVDLEENVQQNLDVSALVVSVGGVGIYPTMVLQTTNLSWMIETVAHEWIHNYLTLRPLGVLYMSTPELRIMNETTASLAGKEIALAVYERFYPRFIPEETTSDQPKTESEPEEPAFDYRAEMYETRVNAEKMLAEGKIDEAEAYMETRRVFFWDNGYRIRKINQAYFAFYGAYADEPGGAAGEDPVGPAVVALREKSSSLAAFLSEISKMTSFEDLLASVEG